MINRILRLLLLMPRPTVTGAQAIEIAESESHRSYGCGLVGQVRVEEGLRHYLVEGMVYCIGNNVVVKIDCYSGEVANVYWAGH